MSKFFVCHEPQCTEVVLNPYRHHLEVHSCDLTDEAIVCLKRQASKRELEILKETNKSSPRNCKKNAEQPISQQNEKPKRRKFGENFIGNVEKKKTLDILSTVPTAITSQNNTEIRSLARMSLVGRTANEEKGKSCLGSEVPNRTVHKTWSRPTLSNGISPRNEKTQKKKKTDISLGETIEMFKNKIQNSSLSKIGELQSSSRISLSRSSKSKLCKMNHVESRKKVESDVVNQSSSGINYNKDLDPTDQRSIASVRPERRLDSLQRDNLAVKAKLEKKISSLQIKKEVSVGECVPSLSIDANIVVTYSNDTALIENNEIEHPSTYDIVVTDSNATVLVENIEIKQEPFTPDIIVTNSGGAVIVENCGIKLEPSTSDKIETFFDSTILVENSAIQQEFSTSLSCTLQQETNVSLTHDIKSEVISATEKDAPVLFQSPKPMQRTMSPPRPQTSPTQHFPTNTLDESGCPPSQPYYNSESSPLHTEQTLHSFLTPPPAISVPAVHPPVTLNQLLEASLCPLPFSNLLNNSAQTSTPNRYYWQVIPPPPNTSHLSRNFRDGISFRSSNIPHQSASPSSSNWNFSAQQLLERQTSSKICDSPKTLPRGQLCSANKIGFPEKSKWTCSMSRQSDLPTKLIRTSLPSPASKKHCLDITSPSSVIPHKLFTTHPDNRNDTNSTHFKPIHQAYGENSAKSTLNLNPSIQMELESNAFNPRIPCQQTGKPYAPKVPSPSLVHIRTERDSAIPLRNHSNNTISDSNEQLVPVETVEKNLEHSRSVYDLPQQSNKSNSSLNAESHENNSLCDETSDVSSTTSMSIILTDETSVYMSRDEIMYRFLVSQYAIRHLSSCVDSSKTGNISYKEALNVQSVLMLLLFLKSGGDMTLLCLITVFDVLGAQNIKGDFQVLHSSTGKSVVLSNNEQSYVKNFIKIVRPSLSKDSYGYLFTTNSLPFTENSFRQALRYCWVKGQIGFDVSVLWSHIKQTSATCKSACDNEGFQNLDISSSSQMKDPVVQKSPLFDSAVPVD